MSIQRLHHYPLRTSARKLRYYALDQFVFLFYDIYRKSFKRKTLEQIINKKEVRIFGLRRSGNHGIINWIVRQSSGRVVFLNNAKINMNPFRSRYIDFKEPHIRREAWGNLSKKDLLIISYEDYSLSNLYQKRYQNKVLETGLSKNIFNVIILRDPFNMYASRLKGESVGKISFHKKAKYALDLWLAYAKEYVGETSYLSSRKITISYNQWCTDIKYRKQIADELKLDFSDEGFSELAGISSFDGKSQMDATRLNTLNRWKHFADNPDYLTALNRKDILHYCKIIFPRLNYSKILESLKS